MSETMPTIDRLRRQRDAMGPVNLMALRSTGCDHAFADVHTGVTRYVQTLLQG